MTKEELIRMCKKGKRTLTKYKVPDGEQKIQLSINDLLEVLQSEPQIVRCKDCKKRWNPVVCILDRDLQEYGGHRTAEYDDWFCKDGERRE